MVTVKYFKQLEGLRKLWLESKPTTTKGKKYRTSVIKIFDKYIRETKEELLAESESHVDNFEQFHEETL